MHYLFVLTLVCFLQSTILEIDLIMVILLSKSLVSEQRINYYLAFSTGLVSSYLLGSTLGMLSITYLLAVKIGHILRRTSLGSHPLFIIPLSVFALMVNKSAEWITSGTRFDIWQIIIPSLLSLPIYLLVRFWEERFVPAKEIKLKI